jgi:hypothetical protein
MSSDRMSSVVSSGALMVKVLADISFSGQIWIWYGSVVLIWTWLSAVSFSVTLSSTLTASLSATLSAMLWSSSSSSVGASENPLSDDVV